MSKIKEYVNVHRRSRSVFMSIADFNEQYGADLPSNKSVEAKFHNDVRRRRRMTGVPVRGALFPIARELGLESASVPSSSLRSKSKFSMRSRRRRKCAVDAPAEVQQAAAVPVSAPAVCDHSVPCSCNAVEGSAPVRRMGMKLKNINISRPSRAVGRTNIAPLSSRRPVKTVAHGVPHAGSKKLKAPRTHDNKQRKGSRHPKGRGYAPKAVPDETAMYVEPVEEHDTFTVSEARAFYEKHAPEFLKTHDLQAVVDAWNKAPIEQLLPSIRAKYGQAPGDIWSVKDVKAFYAHYDSNFFVENELHSVLNKWAMTDESIIRQKIKGRYGTLPGEPVKAIHWTPEIVEQYYNEVYPAKLQSMTPEEIVSDWNRYSVEKVMSACESKYDKAPQPLNYKPATAVARPSSHISAYKRALEDSGEHFDATKILHFVPTNGNVEDFSSYASKMTSSHARSLIDGTLGPYKMFSGEYKSFRAIDADDVNTVLKSIKKNKSGNFFIRVEE